MKKDWDKIINETYTKLFKASTPSVSFTKLVKEAKVDKEGKKHIPYHKYKITSTTESKIMGNIIKKYKIKGQDLEAFKFTIFLGCGPVTKKI